MFFNFEYIPDPFSIVSIADLEQVNISWELTRHITSYNVLFLLHAFFIGNVFFKLRLSVA